MRAAKVEGLGGYQDLKLVAIAKPSSSEGRLLMRVTAAAVAPLGCHAQYFLDDLPWKGRTGQGARIFRSHRPFDSETGGWLNRLPDGYAANIIIDDLGGSILGQALQVLARGGSLATLGHAAGPERKGASTKGFLLFARLSLPGRTPGRPFRSYSNQVGSR
jgi:NADPH:quinone reductase-like Zn-dependent oxidoreductase